MDMVLIEQVLSKTRSLIPDESLNETALRGAVEAALAELLSRLREDVSVPDLGELFTTAASALALSFYVQFGDVSEISGFRAGDVSITRRGASAVRGSALSLRNQAEAMLGVWLSDRGFDFRGVQG